MTALRAPRSFAQATTLVAGVIGWPAVAAIAARSERAVRYWGEDSRATTPPLHVAARLDAAYRVAGGTGAPHLDALVFQHGEEVARTDPCRAALTREIAVVAHEFGEAIAAAVLAAAPGAPPIAVMRAAAEAAGAGAAVEQLVRRLNALTPTGAGPAGTDGGLSA